jgi:FkbM family methyltransferase
MAFRESIRAYFAIHPRRLRDAFRLYSAYAVAVLLRITVQGPSRPVGLFVLGSGNLHVSVSGNAFQVRPRTNDLDIVSPKHEPLTTQWFQVGVGDCVVDVGAHIGRYTLMAARTASRVIAVEPDPSNFRMLERNVKLNGYSNVVLVPKALSSRPGTLEFQLAGRENTGTSSILPEGLAPSALGTRGGTIRVGTDTLDHILATCGLSRIDWLKVDVEGHEVAVLEGGQRALGLT